MNKKELIQVFAEQNGMSLVAAGRAIDGLIGTIQGALKKGDSVSILGFGSFSTRKRAARKGRNPMTGAAIKVPASVVPVFKAGSKFKAAVAKAKPKK